MGAFSTVWIGTGAQAINRIATALRMIALDSLELIAFYSVK
jgi:hypothetical protein